MLVVYVTLLLSTLCSTLAAENLLKSPSPKLKREVVEAGHNVGQDNDFHQSKLPPGYQSLHQENRKLSPSYKSVEANPYNSVYKYKQDSGSVYPQYSYQGPVESGAHTGYRGPTYPPQIRGGGKYSLPIEAGLFTMPVDFKAVSEAAKPTEQIGSGELQAIGGHNRQRPANSHPTSAQSSFGRNKLGTPQSPHALGYAPYSGIDQTRAEEAHGSFGSLQGLQAPPIYKSTHPRGGYTSSIQTSARAPVSPAKLIQSGGAYNHEAGSAGSAGHINGKKIPVLQLESGEQLRAAYSRAFESQPLILSSGLDYHQGSLPSAARVQTSAPFFAPVSGFQAPVLPIQTSSGSPHFPQYRGARVQAYPVINNPSNSAPTYQALLAQPHLHFGPDFAPVLPRPQPPKQQPGLGSYGTVEKIRSDVEIINKEKSTPSPPSKDEDDDKDVDHGYDVRDKQYDGEASQEDKSDYPGKHYTGPQVQGNFKPSKSFPFKQYDDTFGKYSEASAEENDKPNSQYTSYSTSSEEEGEQKSPASKFGSSESSYRAPYSSRYEHEDQSGEEETDKDTSQSSEEHKSEYSYGPKSYRSYSQSKDVGENSSEESYRKAPLYRKY